MNQGKKKANEEGQGIHRNQHNYIYYILYNIATHVQAGEEDLIRSFYLSMTAEFQILNLELSISSSRSIN